MTKKLMVGKVAVGGGAPVSIQSMCNTKTDDVAATVAQIHALEDAGCEIIRVAVPDEDAAKAVDKIKEQIAIPLISDIHFNYKLALMCAERGIDALRINPGNIGGEEKVKAVADMCRQKNIPIRIGVNGGSLEKELRAKYGGVTAEALVESAMGHVRLLNRFDFDDICISVKCSDVPLTMRAYTLLSQQTDYPLHLGVTEAGTPSNGIVKSAMRIGGLVCMLIGDRAKVEDRPGVTRGKQWVSLQNGMELLDMPGVLPAEGGCESHRLSHLRPHPDRPDPYGGGSGAPIDELYEKHHRGGDGLRRQRARRGRRRGCWHRRRQGRGPDFPQRRDPLQGASGAACRRIDGGN